jgi:hypothetical protein
MDPHSPPCPTIPLGEPIEVFRPGVASIFAGFILGFLFCTGATALFWFIIRQIYLSGADLPFLTPEDKGSISWGVAGIGLLTAVGLSLGGIVFGWITWDLLSRQVELCVNGFRYFTRGCVEEVLWMDVASIRQTVCYEKPPLLKGPAKVLLPKLATSTYDVVTKNGKEYSFNGDSVKRFKKFVGLLREQAEKSGIPWEKVQDHE